MAQATAFNEYGVVNDVAVEQVEAEIAAGAGRLFDDLAVRGVPFIEGRAVCQYLVSTIEVEMSHALLKYQMDLHKAARKEQVG